MTSIRRFQESDWPVIWPILRTTFESGDTYVFAPQSTEAEIHKAWVELPAATYVACGADGRVLGTYYLKANQPGLGSHVSNCGYVVAPEAQGQGIASLMCEHSQLEAVSMGFRAMQFNLVVSSNDRAAPVAKARLRNRRHLAARILSSEVRLHRRTGDVQGIDRRRLIR